MGKDSEQNIKDPHEAQSQYLPGENEGYYEKLQSG
jgi:hypothetical protein